MEYDIWKASGDKISEEEVKDLKNAGIEIFSTTLDWGYQLTVKLESIQNLKDLVSICGKIIVRDDDITIYDDYME